jgi:hypothetical protein
MNRRIKIKAMRIKAMAPIIPLSCALMFATGVNAGSIGEPRRASGKANPLKNVYFGEQHLHTADSPDAFAMGTRNSQDDAYNFCKGKPYPLQIPG